MFPESEILKFMFRRYKTFKKLVRKACDEMGAEELVPVADVTERVQKVRDQ